MAPAGDWERQVKPKRADPAGSCWMWQGVWNIYSENIEKPLQGLKEDSVKIRCASNKKWRRTGEPDWERWSPEASAKTPGFAPSFAHGGVSTNVR